MLPHNMCSWENVLKKEGKEIPPSLLLSVPLLRSIHLSLFPPSLGGADITQTDRRRKKGERRKRTIERGRAKKFSCLLYFSRDGEGGGGSGGVLLLRSLEGSRGGMKREGLEKTPVDPQHRKCHTKGVCMCVCTVEEKVTSIDILKGGGGGSIYSFLCW